MWKLWWKLTKLVNQAMQACEISLILVPLIWVIYVAVTKLCWFLQKCLRQLLRSQQLVRVLANDWQLRPAINSMESCQKAFKAVERLAVCSSFALGGNCTLSLEFWKYVYKLLTLFLDLSARWTLQVMHIRCWQPCWKTWNARRWEEV